MHIQIRMRKIQMESSKRVHNQNPSLNKRWRRRGKAKIERTLFAKQVIKLIYLVMLLMMHHTMV
jgi:hypothetical protein